MEKKEVQYSVWSQYQYMYKELWMYDRKGVCMLLLEVVANVLTPLVAAWLPAFMVGILEKGSDFKELILSCLVVYVGVILLYSGTTILGSRNGLLYMFMRLKRLVLKMLDKSTKMNYSQYEQESAQNEMQKCRNALESNAGPGGFYENNKALLTGVLGFIIYSIMIARLHILIVLVLLAMSVVQYLSHEVVKRYEANHREQQAVHNRVQEYLFNQATDIKSGKDVRMYQLQKWLISLYDKENKAYQKQFTKNECLCFISDCVGLILAFLRDAVAYGYLIYLLMQGMNISEFVLYLGVIAGYGNWFNQISNVLSQISRCFVGVSDYRRFVEEEEDYQQGEKELESKEEALDILFEDVCFQYPGSDRMVLENISFHIRKGEKIALVGLNGAGKTTLVKLLCGFYSPTKGRILINGIDITNLNREKYMERIAVLFQDSILLPYTVAQNVTGQTDEEMDREKLWRALEQSGLADKIKTLPQKENSFIGKHLEEDGIQLSGGQIQKLFLARALYKESQMLILDEPTAALDALAESAMYEQYANLVEGKTSVYISHRLSSTRFCDRIFFLKEGKIIEDGSHTELMERNGDYAEMFRVQSQYYKEDM